MLRRRAGISLGSSDREALEMKMRHTATKSDFDD